MPFFFLSFFCERRERDKRKREKEKGKEREGGRKQYFVSTTEEVTEVTTTEMFMRQVNGRVLSLSLLFLSPLSLFLSIPDGSGDRKRKRERKRKKIR